MTIKSNFDIGQKVTTPDGDGEVIATGSNFVLIRLDTGEIKSYDESNVSDNSDAG
jgi:hypothetical protein